MEEQTSKFINKGLWTIQILVIGVLVFFVGQLFLQNKSVSLQNQNQITVSGQGKVYAKPDVAVINLGVTTQGATVADVTSSNATKMNAVIDAVKKLGVDAKDIQTTNYNLTPNYEIQPQPLIYSYPMPTKSSSSKITGYTLEQNIQVKIRDFAKIGDILSQATGAGSNQIGSLQFTIDNPEQYKQEARASAIAQAKENAINLAKESGIKLGKIINVYENYYPVAYSAAVKGMGGGVAESVAPDIQPGQQEVNMTINLTYQVK